MKGSVLFLMMTLSMIFAHPLHVHVEKLRGVTVQSPPFVKKDENGNYSGFAINVLNFIASYTNLTFELYEEPNSTYFGMIDAVSQGKADFAVADITVTDKRKQLVDFSEPIVNSLFLGALIDKNHGKSMSSFQDLLNVDDGWKFGFVNGTTKQRIMESANDKDPLSIKIKAQITEETLLKSYEESVKLVKGNKFAFIGEDMRLDYIAANDCTLKVLHDKDGQFQRNISFALPKASKNLNKFNEAIQMFKKSKEYQENIDRYWRKSPQCEK